MRSNPINVTPLPALMLSRKDSRTRSSSPSKAQPSGPPLHQRSSRAPAPRECHPRNWRSPKRLRIACGSRITAATPSAMRPSSSGSIGPCPSSWISALTQRERKARSAGVLLVTLQRIEAAVLAGTDHEVAAPDRMGEDFAATILVEKEQDAVVIDHATDRTSPRGTSGSGSCLTRC